MVEILFFTEFICNNSNNDSNMIKALTGTNNTSNKTLDIRCNGADYEILYYI